MASAVNSEPEPYHRRRFRAVRAAWRSGALHLAEGAHRLDRVGLVGPLVRAVAEDPGEPQGDPARIARAALDAVERDLHHLLRPEPDHPVVAALRPRQEALR